jgi:hypothetical protein
MTSVIIETGTRRVFASALGWPGWSRSGTSEAEAVGALAAYFPRYATSVARAGQPPPAGAASLEVVERVRGSASTDFGVPEATAGLERTPIAAGEAARQAALVVACWAYLDEVVAAAPAVLRKGPRGGGRDRDAVAAHVVAAEVAYARKIGIRDRTTLASPQATRDAVAALLGQPSGGSPLAERGWTAGYAARRVAWHVLDHAWEIEDRTAPS